MKMRLLIILTLTFVIYDCCGQNKPMDFDYGKVENSRYINSYFGLEITLPEDWKVQTKEQMDDLLAKGKAAVAGNDSKMKAVLTASEINSANLLSVFQYERGSSVEYNPSLAIVAENVKNLPGIKTGKEYLFQARKLLEQSQLKYDYIDTVFEKEVVDNTDFYKMNAEIKYLGLDIKQIYYSTIVNGFSLVLIISYVNDQQKEELLKTINTTRFKN